MTSQHSRKAALSALLMLFALSTAACGSKKPKYPSCDNDKECQAGEFCINKVCVKCRANTDCKKGEQCVRGACSAVAGYCGSDADCPSDKVCKANKCVACQADGECGEGGKCQAGACIRKGMCAKDEDCGEDEFCDKGKCSKGQSSKNDPGPGCNLATIYFQFDSSALSDDTRSALTANAECIKKADRPVALVGHTDPRGTEEYNLALSEQRARSVKDYLTPLVGGAAAKMHVVPKGMLEASGTEEATWSKDRRVDFQWE